MDSTNPHDDSKRFFDVKPSHDTFASPTSRPIINKPAPQPDPMLNEAPGAPSLPKTAPKIAPAGLAINISEDGKLTNVHEPVAAPSSAVQAAAVVSPTAEEAHHPLPDPNEKLLPEYFSPSADDFVVRHHRSAKHIALRVVQVLVILIFLGIIIGDILLDAGVIKTSYNLPHTHFLKN